MIRLPTLLGMLLLLGAPPAWAGDAPPVSVDGAWARLSDVRAGTAFVYLTLTLRGEETDRLVSAETPVADNAQILEPTPRSGREILAPTPAVALDSHAPTILQPQGPHIILKGLKQKLAPGDNFTVTLGFEQAGKLDATVKVLKDPPAGVELPKGVTLE